MQIRNAVFVERYRNYGFAHGGHGRALRYIVARADCRSPPAIEYIENEDTRY
jgi:hypothetical protein